MVEGSATALPALVEAVDVHRGDSARNAAVCAGRIDVLKRKTSTTTFTDDEHTNHNGRHQRKTKTQNQHNDFQR